MRHVLALLALLSLVSATVAFAVTEMKPSQIVGAEFGNAPNQYGYEGLVDDVEQALSIVSCYTVSPEEICVFDYLKRDIKVYASDGEYQRTIDAVWKIDDFEVNLTACDIVVADKTLFILSDLFVTPLDAKIEWSRFQVFSFDMRTGDQRDRYFFKNPDIGTRITNADGQDRRSEMSFTVQLLARDGDVWLYDVYQQRSYPLIRDAVAVSQQEQQLHATGLKTNGDFIYKNRDTGNVELLNANGAKVRDLDGTGALTAVSNSGRYYAMSRLGVDKQWHVSVYTKSGAVVADAVVPETRDRWPENPVSHFQIFEIDDTAAKPALYELYVNFDGVHLVRWGY